MTKVDKLDRIFEEFIELYPENGIWPSPFRGFSDHYQKIKSHAKSNDVWRELLKHEKFIPSRFRIRGNQEAPETAVFIWLHFGIERAQQIATTILNSEDIEREIRTLEKVSAALNTVLKARAFTDQNLPSLFWNNVGVLSNTLVKDSDRAVTRTDYTTVITFLLDDSKAKKQILEDTIDKAKNKSSLARENAYVIGFGKTLGEYFSNTINTPLYSTTASLTNIFLELSEEKNDNIVLPSRVRSWIN